MRSLCEVEMELQSMCWNAGPCSDFGAEERENAALLVKCLLKREGLESDVRCTARELSIFLRGASFDFGFEKAMDLLSLLMAVALTLDENPDVGKDFVIRVNFPALGYVVTTVGRTAALSRRMGMSRMTGEDFLRAFDFRPHKKPS